MINRAPYISNLTFKCTSEVSKDILQILVQIIDRSTYQTKATLP